MTALRAVLALAAAGAARAGWPLRLAAQAAGRERLHASFRASAEARGVTAPPADQYYMNYVDHFDVTSEATYPQRFWTNTEFYNGDPSAPIFVYVEGEGAGSPYSVLGGEHYELARQYGALLLSIEHRYYGASVPVPDLTTPNMRFLSAHQGIADIARWLVAYVAPTYGVSFPATRVVTFGGSYPGALSAWIRQRLPHLVYAAFSTSSPIEAAYDFAGYNTVVGHSLGYDLVGGSSACVANTRAAFTAMDEAFAAGGATRAAMAKKLNSCTDLSAGVNDTMWAASNYGGAVQGMVQYNSFDGTAGSIRGFCETMTNASAAPIDNLAAAMLVLNGPSCVDNSYADFIAQAGSTVVNKGAGGVGLRAWLYQTCVSFSFYQTCEDRNVCPLSLYMTEDSNTQQCADLYGPGFNATSVASRVIDTNAMLGGFSIQASRVLFINGVGPRDGAARPTRAAARPLAPHVAAAAHTLPAAHAPPAAPPHLALEHIRMWTRGIF